MKTTTQPVISDDAMKEMAKFFMKTSIPRILAERKLKGVKKEENAKLREVVKRGNQS